MEKIRKKEVREWIADAIKPRTSAIITHAVVEDDNDVALTVISEGATTIKSERYTFRKQGNLLSAVLYTAIIINKNDKSVLMTDYRQMNGLFTRDEFDALVK